MFSVPRLRFASRAHQELFALTQQGGASISPHKEQPGRCLFSEIDVSLLLNRAFECVGLCDGNSDQVRPSNNSKADGDEQPRNANVFASSRFRGWSSSVGRDIRLSSGPIAQRLEQGTHNPLVPGSNPGGPNSNFRFRIGGFRKGRSGNRRSDCRRARLISPWQFSL